MLSNHLNYYADENATIYCEKNVTVVQADQGFVDFHCQGCRYFNGHLQGEGIECLYEDSAAEHPVVSVRDPFEYAKLRQGAKKAGRE